MENIEKLEKFFIGCAILIVLSYLLIYISKLGGGFLCSLCGYIGLIIQFPTSFMDLFLMNFNIDWIICIIGFLFFTNRIIINNQ